MSSCNFTKLEGIILRNVTQVQKKEDTSFILYDILNLDLFENITLLVSNVSSQNT